MGGFFLLGAGSDQNRSQALTELSKAFAELGFAAPEVIKTDDYVFAGYPSLQDGSLALQRQQDGDFAFVCGTCICDRASGVAAALEDFPAPAVEAADPLMGHYAAVIRDRRTEIRLDRFGGYHLFYSLKAGIVSSSFYAICAALERLTLTQQSACEFVFNGVVSGDETLFGEVALAPIGATIRVGPLGLAIDRPALRVTRNFTGETREDCSTAASLCSTAISGRLRAASATASGARSPAAMIPASFWPFCAGMN